MKPENFTHATATTIKPGDRLTPDPLWNRTSRAPDKLADPCEVLAIKRGFSQTGVFLTVRTANGAERNLDAAWFFTPEVTLF